MKKLPIGIQDFKSIIEGGFLYIDKNKSIFQLTQSGRHFFLSRPRRFGKSLTLHNTSDGRIDAVVETKSHIYLLEFKLDETAKKALSQIETKNYKGKYVLNDKEIIGIGINFSSSTKSVSDWEIKPLTTP